MGRRITASPSFCPFNLSLHSLSSVNSICECCCCVGMELVQERGCQISRQLTQRHARNRLHEISKTVCGGVAAQCRPKPKLSVSISCPSANRLSVLTSQMSMWPASMCSRVVVVVVVVKKEGGGWLQLVEEQLSSSRQNLPTALTKLSLSPRSFWVSQSTRPVRSTERRCLSAGFQTPTD